MVEFAAVLEVIAYYLVDGSQGHTRVLLGDLFCCRALVKRGDDGGQGDPGGLHENDAGLVGDQGNWIGGECGGHSFQLTRWAGGKAKLGIFAGPECAQAKSTVTVNRLHGEIGEENWRGVYRDSKGGRRCAVN